MTHMNIFKMISNFFFFVARIQGAPRLGPWVRTSNRRCDGREEEVGCGAVGGGRPRPRVGLARARRLAWPRAPLTSNIPEPGAFRQGQRHTHGAQVAAAHSSQ